MKAIYLLYYSILKTVNSTRRFTHKNRCERENACQAEYVVTRIHPLNSRHCNRCLLGKGIRCPDYSLLLKAPNHTLHLHLKNFNTTVGIAMALAVACPVKIFVGLAVEVDVELAVKLAVEIAVGAQAYQ